MRCMKLAWLAMTVVMGCGSDDDGEQTCSVTIDFDVVATDTCRAFVCYPTGENYQSISLSMSQGSQVGYTLNVDVVAPTTFAVGDFVLDEMGPRSRFAVEDGTRQYASRQTPVAGTRDSRETARLIIDTLTAPSADPCDGRFTGVLTVGMAEVTNLGQANEAVGPGRVLVTAAVQ
jgi:hypothetical protein